MRKLLLVLFSLFLLGAGAMAQDKLHRKNGEVLKVKILEVGSSEIKYRIFGQEDGPVYILERDRIKKIEYQDGRVEKTSVDIKDPEQYADQRKNALKVSFLGPLFGYTQFTYERSTGVGKAYELSLAVIGAGKNQQLDVFDNSLRSKKRNQFGFAVAAGYKFNKLPDFMFGRTRFTHLMQGGYVKPVIYLGNYSENRVRYEGGGTYKVDRQNVTFGALQIEIGKQWVFGDKFLLDVYGGFGYGADNKKIDRDIYYDDLSAYNYLNLRAGRSPGFSLNGGLKIGMLLK